MIHIYAILIAFLTFGVQLAPPKNPADTPIEDSMRTAAPRQVRSIYIKRYPFGQLWDLVQARALLVPGPNTLSEPTMLRVFMQDRANPNLPALLTTVFEDVSGCCDTQVIWMTSGEVVLSRVGEKSELLPNLKLFFNRSERRLIRQIEYEPFSFIDTSTARSAVELLRIVPGVAEPLIEGMPAPFSRRNILPSQDFWFGPENRYVLPAERPKAIHERIGGDGVFQLPQSSFEDWARNRPGRKAEIREEIGPRQLVGDRLWFGKSFYDSEGISGIGGFGYFDLNRRTYVLKSLPEIRDFSVSALLVEPDAIWLGLVSNQEWGPDGNGIVKVSHDGTLLAQYNVPGIVNEIARHGRQLYIATTEGLSVLDASQIKTYFVDVNLDGTYRLSLRRYEQ